MDSSVTPTHGEREGTAYNDHFGAQVRFSLRSNLAKGLKKLVFAAKSEIKGGGIMRTSIITHAKSKAHNVASFMFGFRPLRNTVERLYQLAQYEHYKSVFIGNGAKSSFSVDDRLEIVKKFETIDARVPIASSRVEGLMLAEMVLNLRADGDLVECGCFLGGSTAKLSLVAAQTSRKLYVFDSFQGLPEVDRYNLRDVHVRHPDTWVSNWDKGRYAATLSHVEGNVRDFGSLDSCKFVPGWFSNTLGSENLPSVLAFAFVDVDIPSSARDCFVRLWPNLEDRGVFASHDVAYLKVLREFATSQVASEADRAEMPILIGGGYGSGDAAPHLGFMVKSQSFSPEYIKSLLIVK